MRFSRAGGSDLVRLFLFQAAVFSSFGRKKFFPLKIATLCYNLSTVLRR